MNTSTTDRNRLDSGSRPRQEHSGLAFLNGLLESTVDPPPFAHTTDIWPREFEHGRAVFEGRPSDRFYNPMGIVHGGWLSALLDTSMACAVHTLLDAGQSYSTIELKTVFVKPVTAATGILVCEGRLLHAGRRIAHAEGRITDANGNLIAYGSESCLITDHRARNGANDQAPGSASAADPDPRTGISSEIPA